jgi:acetyl-CoA carboxylase carboxyl transferase alpha subunit
MEEFVYQEEQQKTETTDKPQLEAWDRVQIARAGDRPTALDYISLIFRSFMELHGDREYGDDAAIVGGLARINHKNVTVIGQQKGRTTKENIRRNFGMPSPEGYRKALRLMKQAEKFHRPIICFVDTPGAFCGIEAEERGQGEAIARNLFEMSSLKVPVLSIVIGEGGSGGALALAVANQVWMLENSMYSILSPEGFASILWKDGKRANEAAGIMKCTAADLKEMGVIEKIIHEDQPVSVVNIESVATQMKRGIIEFLNSYEGKTGEEIAAERYERFRNM